MGGLGLLLRVGPLLTCSTSLLLSAGGRGQGAWADCGCGTLTFGERRALLGGPCSSTPEVVVEVSAINERGPFSSWAAFLPAESYIDRRGRATQIEERKPRELVPLVHAIGR
jgi:hypothetical protein